MPVGSVGDGPKRKDIYVVARAETFRSACMGWIRLLWKRLRWVVCGLFGFLGAGLLALTHPAILLRHSITAQGLTLRSDRPFDTEGGVRILVEVRRCLDASPLGQTPFTADVCIVNSAWRRRVFFLPHPGAIGLSYPFTRHVYISGARVERNVVLAPAGFEVGAHFSLTHTIGHELGHVQTYRHFGRVRTLTHLPPWIQEGFAEYVGGIPDFEFEKDRQAFLAEAPLMGPPRPGAPPYRRLHLLIVFLLERQGWSVDQLFRERPAQAQVEAWLRRIQPTR